MSKGWKTLAVWIALIAVFVFFFQYFQAKEPGTSEYDEQSAVANQDPAAVQTPHHRVRSHYSSEPSAWTSLAITFGPVVVIIGLFIFFMRRMRGGANNIFALRRTTARLVAKPPLVTFADVGGATEAKERLKDVVDFLKRPKVWERAGARLPSGVLLEGPPGLGKTLLARAVAGEAKVPFFEVSASEFVEMFVGVGSARVRDLFESAGKKLPAVIFIDELDAVGRRRGSGANLMHQEREQTLNQLLVSMDGFQKRRGLVVIAATNRADILDAALLRPGRFDIQLRLAAPPESARLEILAIHLKGKPQGTNMDFDSIAKKTEGFSGAELEHLVNEAATAAVRRSGRAGHESVTIEDADFQAAFAQHAMRRGDFDRLDKLLIESTSQLARPDGPISVRARLDDGSMVSGEILWVDDRNLKLRGADGTNIALSRANIAHIEALAGATAVRVQDISATAFARTTPDSA